MKSFATLCIFLLFTSLALSGTSGKISGKVKDAQSGEALVGVNITVTGTTYGASSDIEGNFFILNVPPGEYSVRASSLGFAAVTQTKVRVSIDQTTELNFSLNQEVVQGEEVVVVATRPVVQKDVSSSSANITNDEIQKLPVTSISAVVGLQAGIQAGFVIRGSDNADQTAFMIDGMTLRDERNNTPITSISLSSVQDVQVQTGGFNAEYGNIRSGVVNVVQKEGSTEKYSVSATARYHPATQKHFGPSVYNKDSYWIRPFIDPEVAWVGTKNGTWDKFVQAQYQEFDGWNAISQASLKDNDPTNDLTPEAAQRLFLFQHRKQGDITKPDYDIDAGVGGPVPFGEYLGNLRFFASYRSQRTMYLLPLSEDGYNDYTGQIKFTSDIGQGMKLMVQGLMGEQTGTNNNNAGNPGIFKTAGDIASVLDRVSYIDTRIYATDYWAPSVIKTNSYGAKFTHVLSPAVFYEASLNQVGTKYNTSPGTNRNMAQIYKFGNNYYVDEAPFGFTPDPNPTTGYGGIRFGLGFSNSRDTSTVTTFTSKIDFTAQLNQYHQVKSGFEFVYTDNNVNYGQYDKGLPTSNQRSVWHTYPTRLGLYIQDKFEYEGMIANIGFRMDHSAPGGYWYDFLTFDKALSGPLAPGLDTLLTHVNTENQTTFSPRLGVSFPVTEYSKLYFNYGHFYSMPTPENLFLVRRSGFDNKVTRLANPNNPLPKTVAYELGYEHSLFEQFLIRVAGYYKDVSDQINTIEYVSRSNDVAYFLSVPNSYEDIRGFELTLSKNRGEWYTGFLNYTYMVRTVGRFGYAKLYESSGLQRSYEITNRETDLYQTKPVPSPYARLNVDVFTPKEYGVYLGDWRLNLTGNWTAGKYITWAGGGGNAIQGLENNVQYRDTWGMDLRFSKSIDFGPANIQLFVDMNNALNIKNFSGYGFVDTKDFEAYMKSLHLPADIGDPLQYGNVPGDDAPGDVRKEGAAYIPIVSTKSLSSEASPSTTAFYYDQTTKKYMQYNGSAWVEADQSKLDKVLEDKAYIDMPNMDYFVFLNPRAIFFGIKLSVEL